MNTALKTRWQQIWNQRTFDFNVLKTGDEKSIFQELKRANGFDVVNGGLSYAALLEQHDQIEANLAQFNSLQSIYEIGCGAGANLYLFNRKGKVVGGCDYSAPLINVAQQVLRSRDISLLSANQTPKAPKYDAVFSNSVFSYFPDENYALKVLETMHYKCKHAIGLIDVHDITKKEAFEQYRMATVEDYKNRYKDLPKLFYAKEFFIEFAKQHHMTIMFKDSNIKGYWNNDFIFNVFMYKHD